MVKGNCGVNLTLFETGSYGSFSPVYESGPQIFKNLMRFP